MNAQVFFSPSPHCYPPSLSVSPSLKIPQVSGLEEKQSWLTFSSLRLYTNLLLALPKHITSATDLKTLTEKRHLLNRRKKGRKKEEWKEGRDKGGIWRGDNSWKLDFQHNSPAGSIPPLVPVELKGTVVEKGGTNRVMYMLWSRWKWHSVAAEKQYLDWRRVERDIVRGLTAL